MAGESGLDEIDVSELLEATPGEEEAEEMCKRHRKEDS